MQNAATVYQHCPRGQRNQVPSRELPRQCEQVVKIDSTDMWPSERALVTGAASGQIAAIEQVGLDHDHDNSLGRYIEVGSHCPN